MIGATVTRASLIAAMSEAERGLEEIEALSEQAPEEAAPRLALHEAALHEAWSNASSAYLAQLPRRAVSRCPFSDAAVTIAIDDSGLDGPWWRYAAPLRPLEETPRTLFALTGAMRLGPTVERAPHLVVPGPGAPFVLPRLLEGTSVVAVIASVPVGAHLGFAIAYFAPAPPHLDPPNTWGANCFLAPDGSWSEADDDEDAYDYNLAPWIAAGRLRWIAPGDPALRLRQGVDGCPYLEANGEAAGPQRVQRIQNGEVW